MSDERPGGGDDDLDATRDLWARLLDGQTLTMAERRTLIEALERDESLRARRLADLDTEGLLRGMGASAGAREADSFAAEVTAHIDAERDGGRFVARVRSRLGGDAAPPMPARPGRDRRAVWPFVTAAAGFGLAAALMLLVIGRPDGRTDRAPLAAGGEPAGGGAAAEPRERTLAARAVGPRARIARIRDARGTVLVVDAGARRAASTGAWIEQGQGVVTSGRASGAAVEIGAGVALDVQGDTVVAQIGAGAPGGAAGVAGAEKTEVFVAFGRVAARVSPREAGRPVVLASPHAEVHVTGTRFLLTVSADSTRVDVEEGRVDMIAGGGRVHVAARRWALAREGAAPVVADRPAGGAVLFVTGNPAPSPADRAIRARLERLGFEVSLAVPGARVSEAQARASRLVLISSTVGSSDVEAALFRDLPVPLLTWEANLYDDLGLTEPCAQGDCGNDGNPYGVLIKDASHPVAAGLAGTLFVAPGRAPSMNWGVPNIHAAWIATTPGSPTRALVFAYERGAQMPGLVAPARRVGLFIGEYMAEAMTDAGWQLFDNAVAWCAADGGAGR